VSLHSGPQHFAAVRACYPSDHCRLDHYDDDFIVDSGEASRVDVPEKEFRLDRPR
jgi:hypothetical protein